MTTAATFSSVPKEELESSIEFLLKKTNKSWVELESAAESFTLNDSDLEIYKTIKSLRWLLLGK